MVYSYSKLDIPARFVLSIWMFLGMIFGFAMRINLSVAIVAMVNNTGMTTNNNSSSPVACEELFLVYKNHTSYSKPEHQGEFDWDRNTQYQLLGAFFYGFVAANFPAGILARRWSDKWVFGLATLLTSLSTLLSPIAAQWNSNAFLALRVITGLSQGCVYPSTNSLIGRWSPKMERSRMTSFVLAGCFIGTAIGLIVSGYLIKSNFLGGWPATFYVFGIFGCIWFASWTYLIYDKPEEHPRISQSELRFITENTSANQTAKVPWKSMLTSVPVWATTVAYFGFYWGYYTLMTLMPTYLSNVLHFSIEKNGFLSSIPSVVQMVMALVASYAADKIRESDKLKITTIRKIFTSIGFFGAGLCILLVAFAGCRAAISVVLLCTAVGFFGVSGSGMLTNLIDISPQFAGILSGIVNSIGNCAGVLTPYVAGKITAKGETTHNWGVVFGITAGVIFGTCIIYDMFSSAELQSWNNPANDLTTMNDSTGSSDCTQKKSRRSP